MRPELLSPAGSPEALRAAVQNGAGAVYLGWGAFNARRGAKNFSDQEFADALVYCHERGVRVFLTLNTLVTDRELPSALETARKAARLGVDSVLVQDWGLFDLLRRALPDLPLHASTQMSLFTSGGAREIAADGCERVVIARECSAEDTRTICENCPVEVEVFAHGALCMCYSGQCEMSALIGGRSGNRGRCAQPCRLPYGVNGPAKNTYPLSLKDSCLADRLGEMADMGVACVKLEGRMKRPEYVAVITRIYARLLEEGRGPTDAERAELERAFSRSGFTDGYWRGRHGAAMFGTRPENAPDPKDLFDEARRAYEKDNLRTVPVDLSCSVTAGAPCALTASDRDGHTVTVTGPVPEAARTRALDGLELESRLRKTGGTAYRCDNVVTLVDEGLSLPASAVNALRRDALAALTAARTTPPKRRELPAPPLPDIDCSAETPQFTLSVARLDQLSPALLDMARPARIYVPLEEVSRLETLPGEGPEWCAVLPRVWRDRDEPALRSQLERARTLGFTGVLIGNLGHLPLVRGMDFRLYGDYGLGRLPLMITENCLVQNETGCRLDRQGACVPKDGPCCRPTVLKDRTGAAFPLLPAYGHRTEIQNSKPLYLADRPDYQRLGLSLARLRFTTETAEECVRIAQNYLNDAPAAGEFTRGLYERGVE